MRKLLTLLFLLGIVAWARGQDVITSAERVSDEAVRYRRMEFLLTMDATFNNPYDANEIQVDMIVETPSSSTIVLPCFFDFAGTGQQWRARFAPMEAGIHQYHFELRKNNVLVDVTDEAVLEVSPSAYDGFLKLHDDWNFAYGSGRTFRGIGENIAWEGRSWENDNYTYELFLGMLKNQGGNFFRTWMAPWNLPLEWNTVVDTERYSNDTHYYHRAGIKRMDELVEMCDSLGIHMMLALEWHGSLMTGDRWNINPYNSANGGPASTPSEFFTSAEAKRRYKNKLRYLVARWGYSPSIGAWEFFNEVDNAVYNGTEGDVAIPHTAVTQWHQEMAEYLKSIDPYDHLVTTSVSHREINGLFNVAELDLVQKHIYRNTGNIPGIIEENRVKFSKPFAIGEFGFEWDWNNINDANGANLDYDFRRGLWYGLFSPTPVLPMSWWWEFFYERDTDHYFDPVSRIAKLMRDIGGGEYSKAMATSPVLSLEAYGVRCKDVYFLYLQNNSNSANSGRTITLQVAEPATYYVTSFDPVTGQSQSAGSIVAAGGLVTLSSLSFTARESRIYLLSLREDVVEISSSHNGPHVFPGTLELEDYDKGGEGISYRDLDDVNSGSAYRDDGVDLTLSDGRTVVADVVPGEWLDYTIQVVETGTYRVEVDALIKAGGGGTASLYLDDSPIGAVLLPKSDAGIAWASYGVDAGIIDEGEHRLRIAFDGTAYEIDRLKATLLNRAPAVHLATSVSSATEGESITISVDASDHDGTIAEVDVIVNGAVLQTLSEAPFEISWTPDAGTYSLYALATDNGGLTIKSNIASVQITPNLLQVPYPDANSRHVIPGKIEAEHFDEGSAGVAYSDRTPGNIKGEFRPNSDPDIEACTDEGGGFNLADIQAQEWVEYSVTVEESASYDLVFRVATQMANQRFSVLIDDSPLTAINVPNTGSWQTWKDVNPVRVNLPQGDHVLRLTFETEFFNLNHFTFTNAGPILDADERLRSKVSLHPNPAVTRLRIHLFEPMKRISIYDVQGKLQDFSQTVPEGVYTSGVLPPGLYAVLVETNNGATVWLKAILTN